MATETIDVELPDLAALCPRADLREMDGEPLDSPWHRAAINLLIESVHYRFQNRTDYYVGGNMFIYYSARQARTWEYRGPDFFFVKGVDGTRERRFWLVWDEDGKYPNTIVELLSPRTAKEDRGTKKTIYEQTFRTPEYFLYDPSTRQMDGWRLSGDVYQAISPGENGRFWSEQLGLWLGTWDGTYQNQNATWLRFFDAQSQLVPLKAEAAEERAQTAEAEIIRLKALLAEQGHSPAATGATSK